MGLLLHSVLDSLLTSLSGLLLGSLSDFLPKMLAYVWTSVPVIRGV